LTIKDDWEVSPDNFNWFEIILGMDPIGDPIITSKCRLGSNKGFLVVGTNGISWRIKISWGEVLLVGAAAFINLGKSKWVRWHDVANIIPKEDGFVKVELKKRIDGALKLDKKGNPKIIRWSLRIGQNKDEKIAKWLSRFYTFNDIMLDLFNQYQVETNPLISDSRM